MQVVSNSIDSGDGIVSPYPAVACAGECWVSARQEIDRGCAFVKVHDAIIVVVYVNVVVDAVTVGVQVSVTESKVDVRTVDIDVREVIG